MTTFASRPAGIVVTPSTQPVHPKGSGARILLTSVFGPYAQDDEYGSRTINPMELYQNQVTRVQQSFSLRMFHRSWGLALIQANIQAHCAVLDFPKLDRFIEELKTNRYDVIGITAIVPNIGKVTKMCELIREHQPEAQIVIGGHVANMADLRERIDADHIVRGEGVRWMQRYLGEDDSQPIRHPEIPSGFGARAMGITLPEKQGEVAAALIPSVGCPMGCNFCSTSAMFGGKGNCVHFFETGDELFEVMCQLEASMKVNSFFVMDENFLFHRQRALRLLSLMMEHNKAWSLYVFSSANVLKSYKMEQLVGLGISWVWMGLEGKNSQYSKLSGTDTLKLVRTLRENGIRVLGSTIIGLENHTPDNIDAAIDYAVSHDTEFHQFMLYTPVSGTPLYAEHKAAGTLVPESELPLPDSHGQYRFAHRHQAIPAGMETELLLRAFQRDYEINGPSILRVVRTTLQGWRKHKNHPDARVRARFAHEARALPVVYSGAIWAARRYFRHNKALSAKLNAIQKDLYAEFGLKARLAAPLAGLYILRSIRKEDQRLASGWTYEPPTFYEVKAATLAAANIARA
jgi:radical SAM superfamily enzyme YgiQ (UPF0313 family)